MEMSVREARANFAYALSAAERGERVTITRNGKPVAELAAPSPVLAPSNEGFWERNERIRRELRLDTAAPDGRSDQQWIDDFNDPVWTRELFGPEYHDYFDDPVSPERA